MLHGLQNPGYLSSIFIGIKRAALDGLDFVALMRERKPFSVCCCWQGVRHVLTSYVEGVFILPCGTLVMVRPACDFLKWDTAPLWVPNQGMCGVLSKNIKLTKEVHCH
jgi:hypothetical protein